MVEGVVPNGGVVLTLLNIVSENAINPNLYFLEKTKPIKCPYGFVMGLKETYLKWFN